MSSDKANLDGKEIKEGDFPGDQTNAESPQYSSPDGLWSCISGKSKKKKPTEGEDDVYTKAEPNVGSASDSVTTGQTIKSPSKPLPKAPVYTATVHAQTTEVKAVDPSDPHFIYPFTYNVPGFAILIGNSDFDSPDENTRKAAPLDIRNMYEMFQNLGFKIEYLWNKETAELMTELTRIAKLEVLKQVDCLACVITTHGSEQLVGKGEKDRNLPSNLIAYEHYLSMKNGPVKTRDVLQIFDDDHCLQLRDKPKLFFIQACRSRLRPGQNLLQAGALDPGAEIKIVAPQPAVIQPSFPVHTNVVSQRGILSTPNTRGDGNTTSPDVQHELSQDGDNNFTSPDVKHTMSQDPKSQGNLTPPFPTDTINPFSEIEVMAEIIPPVCRANFLVMFASVTETIGWSYDNQGGWLIFNLYEVLMRKIRAKKKFCLLSALTEVSSRVALECESYMLDPRYSGMKSVPSLEHRLYKDVIFDPTKKSKPQSQT